MNASILLNMAILATFTFPQLHPSVGAIRAALYREGNPRERRLEAASQARVLADQLEEIGECVAAANLLQLADMVAR